MSSNALVRAARLTQHFYIGRVRYDKGTSTFRLKCHLDGVAPQPQIVGKHVSLSL